MIIPLKKSVPATNLHILSQAGFFSCLTSEQLELVAANCSIQEFPGASQIYSLGDSARYFYVLIEGMVRFNLTLGGRQTSAGEILRRGEVFGWAALIESAQRRAATASCITPCVVLALDGNRLIAAMERDHSIGYCLMKRKRSMYPVLAEA
mgnify:FL=1